MCRYFCKYATLPPFNQAIKRGDSAAIGIFYVIQINLTVPQPALYITIKLINKSETG